MITRWIFTLVFARIRADPAQTVQLPACDRDRRSVKNFWATLRRYGFKVNNPLYRGLIIYFSAYHLMLDARPDSSSSRIGSGSIRFGSGSESDPSDSSSGKIRTADLARFFESCRAVWVGSVPVQTNSFEISIYSTQPRCTTIRNLISPAVSFRSFHPTSQTH